MDSENKKNLQSDNWRLSQLDKSLSSPKHPYHHFSTGNLETLRDIPRGRGVDIRKEFIKFHDVHYSANRMKLVVLGREPLDVLEKWVGELFSDVVNKNLPENRWEDAQPYSEDQYLTQVFAKPVMNSRSLDIQFPYEDEDDLYETQPSRYISHLIGHEGPGSILAYIKNKGWANGLSAGPMPVCPGSAFMSISIKLTEEGLQKYQEIVKVIMQYISLLKESPPQKWIVDEVKGMAEVDFKFKQKSQPSSFTSRYSSVMQKPLPREWILSGQSLIRKFDAQAITNALEYLRPDNYRLTVVSQAYPGDWDQKEQWYGTEYKVQKIPSDFEAAIREASDVTAKTRIPELHLPHKNEFIPTKLDVEKKEIRDPLKAPKLIRNDQSARVWWKKDDQFWVPKGSVIIKLRNPIIGATPGTAVTARLFCALVKDALMEYSYDAEIAGLDYELSVYGPDLGVEVSGYSDKMAVLLEKVIVSMRDLEVKPDRFMIIKERVVRAYRNMEFNQPYRQVADHLNFLTGGRGWLGEHFLQELVHVTAANVEVFFPQLLQRLHLEVLAHGNVHKEDALRMTGAVESALKPRILPQFQWDIHRDLLLPPGSDYTYQKALKDPQNVNHSIEYYLQIGDCADRSIHAKTLLLGQTTEELGFDQLRTKEQLGYVVFTGRKVLSTTVGYHVIIQSERPTVYLEERINAFLVVYGNFLESMSEEDFEKHKSSLINRRLEKLKNLNSENGRFWTHITTGRYDFLLVDEDVKHIKPLTKTDLIEFFKYHIHPQSPHRAKVSVHLQAQSSPKIAAGTLTSSEQAEKLVSALSKSFTALGLDISSPELSERLASVDISGGDQAGMLSVISDILRDAGARDEELPAVVEHFQQLLGTVLPGLGIEVKSLINGEATELPEAPQMKETTLIDNVYDYKSSLTISKGPRPAVPLSTFEETEPRL